MFLSLISTMVLSAMSVSANYTAEKIVVDGIEVVRLIDAANKTEVGVVPSLGNNAYEFKVNGRNFLWSPFKSLSEVGEKPAQFGNPLLSPWANRIDGLAYWANGKRFALNPELKNFRLDTNGNPIHGLLVYSDKWKVTALGADGSSASVTSRLEFWRYPELMAQFPFAYNIEITYRLSEGVLQVETAIENLSSDPMPLSLGFHTYYRLDAAPRDDWQVHVGAREEVLMSETLVPTGKTRPVSLADPHPLRNSTLDNGYTNLVRDAAGRAEFWVSGGGQKLRVLFGPKYDVGIVFAPPGRDFICFEPMAGVTNVFNLAHAGLYPALQSIPPASRWTESFWVSGTDLSK
jgi:aldose 1-epimerase